MKLLFVHEVNYLKKPVYEIHEFPELLVRLGHEVTFLDFDEGRKFWKTGSANLRGGRISGRVLRDIQIQLERPMQLGIPGFDRLFVTLSAIPKLFRILSTQRFDVIILYAVPTYGVQTIFLARLFGIPVVFRALDVSHKIRLSFLSPIIKVVEKFVYGNATAISSNNPAMNEYCGSLASKEVPTHVDFPPLDVCHFKRELGNSKVATSLGITSSDKVVAYMGTFFYFSGLQQALTQFAERSKECPNLKFLLIGGGEQANELHALTKKLRMEDKVIFTGFIPYSDLPRYLEVANVAINPLVPSLVANVAFPNKVLQYLASGLPVVSTPLDGIVRVFKNSKNISWGQTPELVMDSAVNYLLGLDLSSINTISDKLPEDLSRFLPTRAAERFECTLLSVLPISEKKN
jgi:glycosyltransferase involved in cell wall biosynthesis